MKEVVLFLVFVAFMAVCVVSCFEYGYRGSFAMYDEWKKQGCVVTVLYRYDAILTCSDGQKSVPPIDARNYVRYCEEHR
jgi:hypothetical protein